MIFLFSKFQKVPILVNTCFHFPACEQKQEKKKKIHLFAYVSVDAFFLCFKLDFNQNLTQFLTSVTKNLVLNV